MKSMVPVAVICLIFVALGWAQAPSPGPNRQDKFTARLSPVPIDATQRGIVTGKGSASAVLVGSKLTIDGTFEGLAGPATVARLHVGLATGVRGAAIQDLTVSKAAGGTIRGSFDLTPQQVESLKKNKLYIQIHSEKVPEGNLWGWLLP